MAGFTGDEGPDTRLYGEYSAKVNCIIDLYGPTVFSLMNYYESSQNHYDPDSPEGYEIGGKNVLEHPELADLTIPMNYLSKEKETPPLLLIHGGRDMLVPFNQSYLTAQKLQQTGHLVEFYKVLGAGHGTFLWTDRMLQLVIQFFQAWLGV